MLLQEGMIFVQQENYLLMKILSAVKKLHFLLFLLSQITFACSSSTDKTNQSDTSAFIDQLKTFGGLQDRAVMVLGSTHFGKEVLQEDQQADIQLLIDALSQYQPNKVVVEWEPQYSKKTNKAFSAFKRDSFDISHRFNEVYQMGFRLAKYLNCDSIYLFDDQTPFIGSLDNFNWDHFDSIAILHDQGFYDTNLDSMTAVWAHNDSLFNEVSLYQRYQIMNSPKLNQINANRMHAYEIRVGIQNSWIGPDWLGRWYRRNVRMAANVLKISQPEDRILIIVGNNHKWILDQLFSYIPEFSVISPVEYLE